MRFTGALSLALRAELDELLSNAQEIFGAIESRFKNLVTIPEDSDFTDLGFSGFANTTVDCLREKIDDSDPDSDTSRDALALLVRLAEKKQ